MTGGEYEIDPQTPEPELLGFVRDYWRRRGGARAMPRRIDIAPFDMKRHLPHILLADVIDGGADFRYRLVGSELQRYFVGNPTGKAMSETLAVFGADTAQRTLDIYRAVVARRTPLRIRGAGAIYAQGPKHFDALLTPLSDDGASVNMIFGTFLFAWDRQAEFVHVQRGPDEAALKAALQDA
ncbi:MAG: PAS domain-containing protein [Rhizomicrobium sp.]